MSTINLRFGLVIRQSRKKRGWSQEALADKANLNRSYLGEIERGDAMPSLATVQKLAIAFDSNMADLVSRCEQRLGEKAANA